MKQVAGVVGRQILRYFLILLLTLVSVPHLCAEIQFNSFQHEDGFYGQYNEPFPVNDVYLYTDSAAWSYGLLYCELDSGILYQDAGWPFPEWKWRCLPGVNNFDSWLSPDVSYLANAHELAYLPDFSGNPSSSAASMTFGPDFVDGMLPPWDGLVMRILFSPDATGKWAIRMRQSGSDATLYTGTITDGRIDWPQPIPGDLTFDGFADESDLEVLKEHWGADPIILGDLGSGDASYDGAVTSADLDIVRANWAGSPPASAVPEPGWCGLMGVLFFFYGLGRRR